LGAEKTFGYAFPRRWAFLFLAVVNIPLVYLALRTSLLEPGLEWVVYILCANIILGPLAVQLVRLSRDMVVTVTERSICGRNFFGRRIKLGWGDIQKVVRIIPPLRGATIVVFPRSGDEKITFAESITGLEELLALIRQRAAGCEMKV
jgi:hypothetical protein